MIRFLPILLLSSGGALLLYSLRQYLFKPKVYVKDGILYGPKMGPYALSDEDMLWLGRCVKGEAGGAPSERAAAAVIWALAQNWQLIDRATPFPTFTSLIRAYSHLLRADALDRNSSWCQSHMNLCDDLRMGIRQELQFIPWPNLPLSIRAAVTKFRSGALSNPVPGKTDWLNQHWQQGNIEVGGNYFGVREGVRIL